MRLTAKLFLSYLVVVVAGLLALSLSTAFVAPQNFTRIMGHMDEPGHMGNGGMMGSNRSDAAQNVNDDLDASFRQAVDEALIVAGIVAIIMAAGVSWFVSRRIVKPIGAMVEASQHIADGNYAQRLKKSSDDELGDLAQSFNQMAAALDETEHMRRQLLADVSHELMTPLASIRGYMEGLEDGVIQPTAEAFQLVQGEAARLQRLVEDLQELSHAESAAMVLDVLPCDPYQLIHTAAERLRPQFDDKGVALNLDLPDDLPTVQADTDRTSQILTNLLGNALHYTAAGEHVTVTAKRVDAAIQFAVVDTGLGLHPADLQRIFQRFYRVDKSRARASGGSGIGLTIARHLVEAHRGCIWADSDGPGQGSTFYFTLPVA